MLGPVFFLSYLLSILSPLPGLYLHVGTPERRRGQFWSGVALVVGSALSAAIKGWPGSLGYFLFASLPAMVLGELLLRRKGPEKAILGAAIAVLIAALSFSLIAAKSRGVELLPMAKSVIEIQAKSVAERLLSQNKGDLSDQMKSELEAIQKNPSSVLQELPGLTLTGLLLLAALPCLAVIRWNPKGFLRRTGIPRDFLRRWKAPDWLVWPALLSGALLLYEMEYLSALARNALKPIILIYFFQGMSILAFFLDSLRLRGPLRVIIYAVGVLFATPMVVSFGFFDLWFNFRRRARGRDEEKDNEL